jgi:cell division protein FtsQ
MRFLIGRSRDAAKPAGKGAAKAAAARRPRRRFPRDRRDVVMLGLGLMVLAGTGGGAVLYKTGAVATFAAHLENGFITEAARLGLAVNDIEVEGRVMSAREAVLRAIGADRGTPILGLSPTQIKAQLEMLPWVRSASVERRLPDTLHIHLVERAPLAFWQRQGKLLLIDQDGTVITGDRLDRFPGLIVTVGDDAPTHAAALLGMLAAEPTLAGRVVAAVRVGGRRWDLHLDNGIDVELPEERAEDAWAQLAQLERSSRLLARNVEVVDMRLPDRLVVRVTPEPPKEPVKKGRQPAKST